MKGIILAGGSTPERMTRFSKQGNSSVQFSIGRGFWSAAPKRSRI
jgi:hypothetical protein